MIKKLRLKNFLSYKDATIDFTDFNVIVGANASGKSNLTKALITLKNLITGGFNSLEEFDGFLETIFCKSSPETESLLIEAVIENPIEVKLSNNGGKVIFEKHYYTIELKYGAGIIKEKYHVLVKDRKEPFKILDRNEKKASFNTIYTEQYSKSLNESLDEATFKRLQFQPIAGKGLSNVLMLLIPAYTDSFLTYSLVSSQIVSPSGTRNQRVLNTDGRNLAGVLEYYKTHDKQVLESINEIISRCIPNIEFIDTKPLGLSNNYFFTVREKDGKDYVLNELSEGTDLFIGLITAMVTTQFIKFPKGVKGILIIEEPEKNLHPQLMEEIVSVAKSLTDKFQVIITTHSTDLVGHLKHEDLILIDKNGNGTQLHRVKNTNELQSFLEEFSLDQVWMNNDLGGGTVYG